MGISEENPSAPMYWLLLIKYIAYYISEIFGKYLLDLPINPKPMIMFLKNFTFMYVSLPYTPLQGPDNQGCTGYNYTPSFLGYTVLCISLETHLHSFSMA